MMKFRSLYVGEVFTFECQREWLQKIPTGFLLNNKLVVVTADDIVDSAPFENRQINIFVKPVDCERSKCAYLQSGVIRLPYIEKGIAATHLTFCRIKIHSGAKLQSA